MNPSLTILIEALRDALPMLRGLSDERIIKKMGGTEVAEETADAIAGFISFGVKGTQLQKNQQLAITCKLFQCLIRLMKERNKDIALTMVMSMIQWIPDALDQDYPGYADSGILLAIVQPSKLFLQSRG